MAFQGPGIGAWRLDVSGRHSTHAPLLAMAVAQDASSSLGAQQPRLRPALLRYALPPSTAARERACSVWSRNGTGRQVVRITPDSQLRSIGGRHASESKRDSPPQARPIDPRHKVRNRNEVGAALHRLRARSAARRQGRAMKRRKPCDSHATLACRSIKMLIIL